MEITRLKDKIENNNIDNVSFIFVSDDLDTDLIIDQYLNEISKRKSLIIKYIDKLEDIPDASFIIDDHLYVIKADKWDNDLTKDNVIILCQSSKNKDAIKIPKLEEWQVVDYALSLVKGVPKQDLEWLIKKYDGKYMMFINDIIKLSCFNEGSQKILLDHMIRQGEFNTISNLTIFDLTNAIIKRDKNMVKECLKVKNYVDITPMHFLTIISNSFRNIIRIQLDPTCTYQELGISDKQFYVIKKYNCGYYTPPQLVDIMELISGIEYKFKYEELPVENIIEYATVKILGV